MPNITDDTVFVRVVTIGRARTWLFSKTLRRQLQREGINAGIVQYVPGSASSGFLNEVQVKARLSPETWESIAVWSQKHFPSLHVDHVIRQQLTLFTRYGITGEEKYASGVA